MIALTNQSKNSAVFTNGSKNAVSLAGQSKSVTPIVATNGLYYGFGAFTYSSIAGGTSIAWANQSKN